MPTEIIGVESMDSSNQDQCIIHFTNQTSFTMTSSELAECIFESPKMQRSASIRPPTRRCYMKEWPGKLC